MDKITQDLLTVLHVILDNVDYTRHACSPTEMVGACLPPSAISDARKAIAQAEAA